MLKGYLATQIHTYHKIRHIYGGPLFKQKNAPIRNGSGQDHYQKANLVGFVSINVEVITQN